ncbi:MAG: LysM peptidoglycan-binding domain-containing protein [Sphingobacteriales bacterium]|jgi:LysM repeat protein|nr:LysM peptidoglycan-binding domain-containing protein [Sphingobacteriales bacterium]MBP9140256.1 LysM peptidoglycan-binding domain-containing protein [Chitinophagales bacterium]MDA0197610.1 LysM peptidoglycan-binding domain-containing protein [Bacteroidota bacterium]MBK6889031.1 LysM peptidoglycan-binding domain-containing protein [Sphingobacteriales bacterium]MBK7528465.1 LysM peptidoglycan-binding domain-containing protein [Sphingobacteriales bacterium]
MKLSTSFNLSIFYPLVLIIGLLFAHNSLNAQCPPSKMANTHVVQPKENLYRIAKKYHTTVAQLCALNNLNPNDILPVCKTIILKEKQATANNNKMPQNTNTHIVKPGENILSLATYYGFTENHFRSINNLQAQASVFPGMELITQDCAIYTDPYFVLTSTNSNASDSHVQPTNTAPLPSQTTSTPSSLPSNTSPAPSPYNKQTPIKFDGRTGAITNALPLPAPYNASGKNTNPDYINVKDNF